MAAWSCFIAMINAACFLGGIVLTLRIYDFSERLLIEFDLAPFEMALDNGYIQSVRLHSFYDPRFRQFIRINTASGWFTVFLSILDEDERIGKY